MDATTAIALRGVLVIGDLLVVVEEGCPAVRVSQRRNRDVKRCR